MAIRAVSSKTLKNESGNYPVSVSKSKIAQIKSKKNKTTKHVEGKHTLHFRIVKRFIAIGQAFLDAPHRKVSTIVFLSSIVEVLPLFTSIAITQR